MSQAPNNLFLLRFAEAATVLSQSCLKFQGSVGVQEWNFNTPGLPISLRSLRSPSTLPAIQCSLDLGEAFSRYCKYKYWVKWCEMIQGVLQHDYWPKIPKMCKGVEGESGSLIKSHVFYKIIINSRWGITSNVKIIPYCI